MMHYQSHQARWQYIPLAAPKLTRWQRFCRWLNDLFTPMLLPEGRRRIDPEQPYGHWSAGFQPPALPQAKEKAG